MVKRHFNNKGVVCNTEYYLEISKRKKDCKIQVGLTGQENLDVFPENRFHREKNGTKSERKVLKTSAVKPQKGRDESIPENTWKRLFFFLPG